MRIAFVIAGVAGLVLSIIGVPASAATSVSAARVAPEDVSHSVALQQLSACLSQKKQGDLVLLMDTSGSLSEGDNPTDPKGFRVDAAELLLDQLLVSMGNSKAAIDVAMLGFDSDVDVVTDFTSLTAETLPGLKQSLAGFREKDHGFETDFWTALDTLSATMAKKAVDSSRCQFFVWFTDGQFTLRSRDEVGSDNPDPPRTDSKQIPGHEGERITDANKDAIMQAGVDDICRAGGIADRLRIAGITTIAVGLGPTAGGAAPLDFGLMQSVAEQAPDNCGAQPPNGLFVSTTSLSDLVLAFGDLFAPGPPSKLDPKPICPVQAPVECGVSFPLSDALSKIHITAIVDNNGIPVAAEGLAVELTGPSQAPPFSISGDAATAAPVNGLVGPIEVSSLWRPRGPLTLDMTRPPGASWAGVWTLKFIDVSGQNPNATVNVHLVFQSDLMATPIPTGSPWRAGDPSGELTVQLQQLDGSPVAVTPELQAVTTVTTDLVPDSDPGAKLTQPTPPGTPFTFDLPTDFPTGSALVQTRLIVTLPGLDPFPEVIRQAKVEVLPPVGSPSVPTPGPGGVIVDFGTIEGTAASTATITVLGPADGDGCVWVPGQQPEVLVHPKDVGATTSGDQNSADNCLKVPAGKTVPLSVTLTPTAAGNGPLQGRLKVALAPDGHPERASESTLSFRAEMIRTAAPGAKAWVFITLMLVGLLIPLLIFWLLRRWTARFPSGDPLSATVLRGEIDPSALSGPGDSGLVTPTTGGWQAVGEPSDGGCSLSLPGAMLRARAGWKLTEPGYAVIDGEDVGICGSPPQMDPKTGRPVMPLSVQGVWLVLAPRGVAISPAPRVPVRVILVVSSQADTAMRDRLLGDAVRDAPAMFASARAAAIAADPSGSAAPGPQPPSGPAPSDNPFGNPTGGTISPSTPHDPFGGPPTVTGPPGAWVAPDAGPPGPTDNPFGPPP